MRLTNRMRHPSAAIVILSWGLATVPFVQCVTYPSLYPQSSPSLPFQIPQYLPKPDNNKGLLSQFRDSVIQWVWNIHPSDPLHDPIAKASGAKSSPPSSLLARYGGDLVLRFKIQSEAEATALTEAITVLFLDVWEFTTEWVDIRLSKDVVCSLPRSPQSHGLSLCLHAFSFPPYSASYRHLSSMPIPR